MKTATRPSLKRQFSETIALLEIIQNSQILTLNLVQGALVRLLKMGEHAQVARPTNLRKSLLTKIAAELRHLKRVIIFLPKTFCPCLPLLPEVDALLSTLPA